MKTPDVHPLFFENNKYCFTPVFYSSFKRKRMFFYTDTFYLFLSVSTGFYAN